MSYSINAEHSIFQLQMSLRTEDLKTSGTYILLMKLSESTVINIGALGERHLQKGYYAYVGSAFGPGGLYARLKHHCLSDSRPRWHIDYLKKCTEIEELWYSVEDKRLECIWAKVLNDLPESICPITGFGASDCRCNMHLFYFLKKPAISIFKKNNVQKIMKKQFDIIISVS